jgi:hypothetical protein
LNNALSKRKQRASASEAKAALKTTRQRKRGKNSIENNVQAQARQRTNMASRTRAKSESKSNSRLVSNYINYMAKQAKQQNSRLTTKAQGLRNQTNSRLARNAPPNAQPKQYQPCKQITITKCKGRQTSVPSSKQQELGSNCTLSVSKYVTEEYWRTKPRAKARLKAQQTRKKIKWTTK